MMVSIYELKNNNSKENKNKYFETWFESKISSNFEIYLGINMTEEMSAFEMYHKAKNTNGKRKHNGKKVKPNLPWFKYFVGSFEFEF